MLPSRHRRRGGGIALPVVFAAAAFTAAPASAAPVAFDVAAPQTCLFFATSGTVTVHPALRVTGYRPSSVATGDPLTLSGLGLSLELGAADVDALRPFGANLSGGGNGALLTATDTATYAAQVGGQDSRPFGPIALASVAAGNGLSLDLSGGRTFPDISFGAVFTAAGGAVDVHPSGVGAFLAFTDAAGAVTTQRGLACTADQPGPGQQPTLFSIPVTAASTSVTQPAVTRVAGGAIAGVGGLGLIVGQRLTSGTVTVGGVAARIIRETSTAILFIAPKLRAGTYPVVVRTRVGESAAAPGAVLRYATLGG